MWKCVSLHCELPRRYTWQTLRRSDRTHTLLTQIAKSFGPTYRMEWRHLSWALSVTASGTHLARWGPHVSHKWSRCGSYLSLMWPATSFWTSHRQKTLLGSSLLSAATFSPDQASFVFKTVKNNSARTIQDVVRGDYYYIFNLIYRGRSILYFTIFYIVLM